MEPHRHALPPLLLLLLVTICLSPFTPSTHAHPGGFSDGRASCGSEYSTARTAFDVVDVAEAWYVRRAATCDFPYFWTTFETTKERQRVYVAANVPEIARFSDKLQYNGILFGPGLDLGSESIVRVPKGIAYPVSYRSSTRGSGGVSGGSGGSSGGSGGSGGSSGGSGVSGGSGGSSAGSKLTRPARSGKTVRLRALATTPPATYADCRFVDNDVMSQYCAPKDGRCTETITLDADYKDALVAGLEYSSEWLYSGDYRMADIGRYWLLSWLTDRATGAV